MEAKPEECVLEAIYEDVELEEETLDGDVEDVEMLDAGALDGDHLHEPGLDAGAATGGGGGEGGEKKIADRESSGGGIGANRRKWKKKKRKNKRGPTDMKVTDINRFVIDTCRHLKEKKPYLVWNAVGCLGVSAISDLLKEVDTIQSCGGQKTADGKRLRTGGGILWNILKTREPKAFNEIMAKGREFEKQFRPQKIRRVTEGNEVAISPKITCAADGLAEQAHTVEEQPACAPSSPKRDRKSVLNRIRVPVAYDDLFEEGEIV